MRHLIDTTLDELTDWLEQNGQPKYRAKQIRRWVFQGRAQSFDDMTDLPLALREKLREKFQLWTTKVVRRQQSTDGTEKLLLELADQSRIECVLIREAARRTICVSTQVGCAMGCVFCASGLDGVDRNLNTGEILEQLLFVQAQLPEDERLSHIVVMGMGEPLANLDALLPALRVAADKEGLGISNRRITISTVGLPPAMDRLIDTGSPFHLAVSLHAHNDHLRNELVPVNKNIGLDKILAAADRYFESSGRRLTFEYVLLAGINDGEQHARGLVKLLRGRPALLNVIPFNPVSGLDFRTPSKASIDRFRSTLEAGGINIQFRQRKGDEIDAACGQLRRAT